jgi:hypothetical protein
MYYTQSTFPKTLRSYLQQNTIGIMNKIYADFKGKAPSKKNARELLERIKVDLSHLTEAEKPDLLTISNLESVFSSVFPVLVLRGFCLRGTEGLDSPTVLTGQLVIALREICEGLEASENRTVILSNDRPLCIQNGEKGKWGGCMNHTKEEMIRSYGEMELFFLAAKLCSTKIASVVCLSKATCENFTGNKDFTFGSEYKLIVPSYQVWSQKKGW